VQRGHDPKGYALYAYGGMGPAFGAISAAELSIGRVVVPPHPGLFSALGLLVADLKRIYRETSFAAVADDTPGLVEETFARMRTAAVRELETYGCHADEIVFEHALEMRFRGQGFELIAPVDPGRLGSEGAGYLQSAFRAVHLDRYGTSPPNEHVEIVTYRLVAQVASRSDVLQRISRASSGRGGGRTQKGTIIWRGRERECRFALREDLAVGARLEGLSIIEEPTATTLVPPGWSATVHQTGAVILERAEPW
jgi:N-methylhydantoinase A